MWMQSLTWIFLAASLRAEAQTHSVIDAETRQRDAIKGIQQVGELSRQLSDLSKSLRSNAEARTEGLFLMDLDQFLAASYKIQLLNTDVWVDHRSATSMAYARRNFGLTSGSESYAADLILEHGLSAGTLDATLDRLQLSVLPGSPPDNGLLGRALDKFEQRNFDQSNQSELWRHLVKRAKDSPSFEAHKKSLLARLEAAKTTNGKGSDERARNRRIETLIEALKR